MRQLHSKKYIFSGSSFALFNFAKRLMSKTERFPLLGLRAAQAFSCNLRRLAGDDRNLSQSRSCKICRLPQIKMLRAVKFVNKLNRLKHREGFEAYGSLIR